MEIDSGDATNGVCDVDERSHVLLGLTNSMTCSQGIRRDRIRDDENFGSLALHRKSHVFGRRLDFFKPHL